MNRPPSIAEAAGLILQVIERAVPRCERGSAIAHSLMEGGVVPRDAGDRALQIAAEKLAGWKGTGDG